MSGPSVTLDPTTHAVRPDLADVRLAEYVFAPHYAEAVAHRIATATPLNRVRGAEPIADLDPGERFEVLDLLGSDAWGVVPALGLVGYIDRDALDGLA